MAELQIEQQTRDLIDALKAACGSYGLGNSGNEYLIIIQIFLYKYMNDKFGYEAKRNRVYGKRLLAAKKWDVEYDTFTADEVEDLFSYLPAGTPRLRPEHTLAHLYNAQQKAGFADVLDATLLDIANLNASIFSIVTADKSTVTVFEAVTSYIKEKTKRDNFATALVTRIAQFNFEDTFEQKYDFFSSIFEYLIKDYNTDGGGRYAEYYTPRAVATIMARLLVPDNADLHSVTCYDPSAGSGTLLMALAHQIGEDRCQIYSQDISQKSSEMLRLNLILNNLVGSIQNVVMGNTLLSPQHKEKDGSLKRFDYIVSNPPFKLDFSDYSKTIEKDHLRFFAGVPGVPKKKKDDMAIYTCFLQHVLFSLAEKGKAAIVVPTGFLTAAKSIEKKIRERIVNEGWLRGVVSMPSNIFANTSTNVSVIFIDKDYNGKDAVFIDASKLGTEIRIDEKQRTVLSKEEIDYIVNTFHTCQDIDGFSAVRSKEQIIAKGYSFSAGQYFGVKLEHIEISQSEFDTEINKAKSSIQKMLEESKCLEEKIADCLNRIEINL